MANKTIPNLTAAGAATLADLIEVSQGGSSFKETLQQIKDLLGVTMFASPTSNWPASTTDVFTGTFAHALGSIPRLIRGVWVCTANDAASGWQTGDELDHTALTAIDNGLSPATPFTALVTWASATQVGFVVQQLEDNGPFYVAVKSGGDVIAPTTLHNFKPKIYAML